MTEDVSAVRFVEIEGAPGYWVDDLGRFSCTHNSRRVPCERRFIDGSITDKGYVRVEVHMAAGRKKPRLVHNLVLEAFVGPRPPGMEGCHWDGNKQNNRPGNLRWDTSKNNAADNIRLGVLSDKSGSKNGNAGLTEAQVSDIKRMLVAGEKNVDVAKRFETTVLAISKIYTGRTWATVPWPSGYEPPKREHAKLDREMASELYVLSRAGWNLAEMSQRYGVCKQTICNVLSRKNFKDAA